MVSVGRQFNLKVGRSRRQSRNRNRELLRATGGARARKFERVRLGLPELRRLERRDG